MKTQLQLGRQQVALGRSRIGHQWLLVTMKWWGWPLVESSAFANMMEYVSVNAIEPSWNIFGRLQTTGVPLALKRDATDGVQSVHVEVKHPDEINFLTQLVHAKGSRSHAYAAAGQGWCFRKGLMAFENHQYGNTIGRDLWNALGDADLAVGSGARKTNQDSLCLAVTVGVLIT